MSIAPCAQETKPSCAACMHELVQLRKAACAASTAHVCIGMRYCLIKRHSACDATASKQGGSCMMKHKTWSELQRNRNPRPLFTEQLFRGKYLQSRVQFAFCGRACVRRLRGELFKDYSVSSATVAKRIFELRCEFGLNYLCLISFGLIVNIQYS